MENKLKKSIARNIASILLLLVVSVVLTAILAMIFTGGVNIFKTSLLSLGLISLLLCFMFVIFYLYIFYQVHDVYKLKKNIYLTISIMVITLITTFGVMRYIDPFAAPLAMSAVMVAMLVSNRVGFMANAFTSVMTMVVYLFFEYITDGVINLAAVIGIVISLLESYGMMFMIKQNYTRFMLSWGAMLLGVVFAPIAMMFSLLCYGIDARAILFAGLWSFVGNAISVGIFTAMLPLYESVFDIWTNFKLADACSLSRPLLKRLLSEAPGTFNHCLVVANLSESCALAIGENSYMAKAAAIYHDIGKLNNPDYYVENQSGYNPHDDLIPEESVRMIIKHALDGYKMLKDMHMPEAIADVALQHHGTTPVMYFYNKANNMSENALDIDDFRYPGPKPTTKIAAIVMISDVVEASARAKKPKDQEELKELISDLIEVKISEGQFADCNITFNDLTIIKETMSKVVPGILHKRISYEVKD